MDRCRQVRKGTRVGAGPAAARMARLISSSCLIDSVERTQGLRPIGLLPITDMVPGRPAWIGCLTGSGKMYYSYNLGAITIATFVNALDLFTVRALSGTIEPLPLFGRYATHLVQ